MAAMKKDKESTRQDRKLKKRKFEDTIPNLPGDVGSKESQEVSQSAIKGEPKGTKKRKFTKATREATAQDIDTAQNGEEEWYGDGKRDKRKGSRAVGNRDSYNEATERSTIQTSDADPFGRRSLENLAAINGKSNIQKETLVDEKKIKKSKKELLAEGKAAEAAISNASVLSTIKDIPVLDAEEAQPWKSKKNNRNREKKRKGANGFEAPEKAGGKASRFIVFTGNLPFTATTESIQKHFAAVHPKSIRHLTKKDEPEKSKGCAFLEFDGYDHMKACLKSFHHSMFDDGISPPRKINVELTAGGGGNKQNRHAKIAEKNQKLSEERLRRMHEEGKGKLVKRDSAIDHNDVHPSRRARVPDIS